MLGKSILRRIAALCPIILALSLIDLEAQITTIQADFGPTPRPPVPANLLGVNISIDPSADSGSCAAANNFKQCFADASINHGRKFVQLDTIFANQSSPDFTDLDNDLSGLNNAGITDFVLVLTNTPPALQQQIVRCSNNNDLKHVLPNNLTTWAQDALMTVQNVTSLFSGNSAVTVRYEIWNEPDTDSGLCTEANTDAERLHEYLSLYEAAAPLIQGQTSAVLGGPVLADPTNFNEWVSTGTASYPGLLTDPKLSSSNVNFVSYHHYLTGGHFTSMNDVVTATTNQMPLYLDSAYGTLRSLSLKSIPPVYITETNDSAETDSLDCCRNVGYDGTDAGSSLSGTWNILSVVQELSGIYGNTDMEVPFLYYFRADPQLNGQGSPAGFCLFAVISADDCAPPQQGQEQPYAPYPQYYALKLLNFAHFEAGVNLTKALPGLPNGLEGIAYMTPGTNPYWMILVANPTPNPYNNSQPWEFDNVSAGSTPSATAYWLTCSNATTCGVSSATPTITSSVGGITKMTFNVPAYTAVAIVLHNPQS